MLREMISIYCENHKKHKNTMYVEGRGRNAKFVNLKAGGARSFKELEEEKIANKTSRESFEAK
jgi:hypothetical protein